MKLQTITLQLQWWFANLKSPNGPKLSALSMGHRQKKNLPSSDLLVPANRAGPVRPESSSLFLLTSPGHNSNKSELGRFFFLPMPHSAPVEIPFLEQFQTLQNYTFQHSNSWHILNQYKHHENKFFCAKFEHCFVDLVEINRAGKIFASKFISYILTKSSFLLY